MLATERAVIETAIGRRACRRRYRAARKRRPRSRAVICRVSRSAWLSSSRPRVPVSMPWKARGVRQDLRLRRPATHGTRPGYRVIGCALAARAAAQLEKDAAIVSMTLDRLFNTLDTARISTDHGTVIVVDEAAMVGTRKLARLLDHAEATNAKVVLIGDHHQLPEIDAGGAFAGIVKRLHGTRLVQNHRQLESWERHAVAQLRDGDVDHGSPCTRRTAASCTSMIPSNCGSDSSTTGGQPATTALMRSCSRRER